MKKIVGFLLWFPFLTTLGACNTSSTNTEIPATFQPIETELILPTSTVSVVPTNTSVVSAIPTSTTEPPHNSTYEDCISRWLSAVKENWALCSGFENPITIMNLSGKSWEFSYNSYYKKDVRNLCTRLHYLTNDKSYMYFSLDLDCILIEPDFIDTIGMFRMNLLNGEVVEILKASYDFETYDGDYYSVSISPTGRRMAYLHPQESPLTLYVVDLQTGEKYSFQLEERYERGGRFSWSEDGTKLVFMLQSGNDYDHFISMVFLDLLRDDSMVTFIKDKNHLWISSRLEIIDKEVKIYPTDDEPLVYDIETGILSLNSQ